MHKQNISLDTNFEVDVEKSSDGYDVYINVYIGPVGMSEKHDSKVTASRIAELIADDIERIAEGLENEFCDS